MPQVRLPITASVEQCCVNGRVVHQLLQLFPIGFEDVVLWRVAGFYLYYVALLDLELSYPAALTSVYRDIGIAVEVEVADPVQIDAEIPFFDIEHDEAVSLILLLQRFRFFFTGQLIQYQRLSCPALFL